MQNWNYYYATFNIFLFSLRTVRQKPVTLPRLVKAKKGNKRNDGSKHVVFEHNKNWRVFWFGDKNRDKRDEKDPKC